jgi:DNA-binding NarL/FixJ family response regulator
VGRFKSLVEGGLERVLGEDPRVRVLGSGLAGIELERFVASEAPHVTIMDDDVPYALLLRLKRCQPAMGVIVLFPTPGRLCGEMLVEAGASCIAQTAPKREVLNAVRLAARNIRTYLPAQGARPEKAEPEWYLLTQRENDVLGLLSDGLTNPEIAAALHLSPRTVGTHLSVIFRKLGVRNRRELIGLQVPMRQK